ncbi:hypothetical protein AB0B85_11360 [Micromonospora sp. NPDC049044]|uniref:hypothetical protein n=1 Tax=Micromonospora sp. NPDC049044 TaxID=3154827 RepID=UPI0033CDCC1A
MIEMSVDQQALQAIGKALKSEVDGKMLRRDLAREMRQALEPAKSEVRSALMSMQTGGMPVEGAGLRTQVLKGLKAEARLSGKATGARLRIKRTPGVRGFTHAPKRLNRQGGWRHKVFGRDVWVQQEGQPGYFDRAIKDNAAKYRDAVLAAMEKTAQRIARNAR